MCVVLDIGKWTVMLVLSYVLTNPIKPLSDLLLKFISNMAGHPFTLDTAFRGMYVVKIFGNS